MDQRTCRVCGRDRPVSDFYRHRRVCRGCYLDRARQYRRGVLRLARLARAAGLAAETTRKVA